MDETLKREKLRELKDRILKLAGNANALYTLVNNDEPEAALALAASISDAADTIEAAVALFFESTDF